MSKSLSESAAEILSASLGKTSKESMGSIPSDEQEIGGPTTENPAGVTNPGAKAAAPISPAAKPATKGDAKSVKVASMAEEEEISDEELEQFLDTLSEEELNELLEEISDEDEDEEVIEEEMSDEELDEYLDSLSEEELEALAEEVEQMNEKTKWRSTNVAQKVTDPDGMDSVSYDYHSDNPRSTGMKRATSDTETPDYDRRRPAQVTTQGPRKGMAKRSDIEGLKSKIRGKQAYGDKSKPNLPEDYEQMNEEEIIEARMAKMKGMVDSSMGSCKEDVDALFNGESLSEEFRTKATTIFESAVRARVETIIHEIAEENEAQFEDEVIQMQEQLSNQIDEYLNYVVENWIADNQVAVETGLRSEIAEGFINGLKNLFMEHYIEVPEEKADLVEEMAARVVEVEESLQESANKLATLQRQLNESKSIEILRRTCEGLTEMQVQKIKSLAAGVKFTTEGDYTEKLAMIRESYFPNKSVINAAPQTVVETQEDHGASNNIMDAYVQAITKQLPK